MQIQPLATAGAVLHPPVPSVPSEERSRRRDEARRRARELWSAGDFSVIGTTLQIVGERLCESVDLRAGASALDVACGNGNTALAAARRYARVTGVDLVPELLASARRRAEAEGLALDLRVADCAELPFEDGEFDFVLSSFGAMFAAEPTDAARELARVCRPGGRIGLASWTPTGFVGALIRQVARSLGPRERGSSPLDWGVPTLVAGLFQGSAQAISFERQTFWFRYRTPVELLRTFGRFYGPLVRTFESLGPDARKALEADLLTLLVHWNRAEDGTLVVPGEYLAAVFVRR